MSGRPVRLVAALAAAVSLAAAAPAAAQQPSLNGEFLSVLDVRGGGADPEPGVRITDIDCNPEGGLSTGHYRAEGTATGPYPGTFVETGTFTVDYDPMVGGPGNLVAFDASFVITSGDTTITGTRTLVDGMIGEMGYCHPADGTGDDDRAGGLILGDVAYEALITTPTGQYTDSGTGRVNVTDRGNVASWSDAYPRIREFAGSFVNPQPEATPVEPEEPTGPPASTAGCKVTFGGWYADGKKVTLAGQARAVSASEASGSTTFHDHGRGLTLQSETVLATVCEGGRAEIHGTGEVDGQPVEYRIDMVDGGKTDTYRIRWNGSSTYDSGERVLSGGNITVH